MQRNCRSQLLIISEVLYNLRELEYKKLTEDYSLRVRECEMGGF